MELPAAVTVLRLRTGGDEVRSTDDALVVRFRSGTERRHAWGDVLELSWSSPQWADDGSGPVARVRVRVRDYDTRDRRALGSVGAGRRPARLPGEHP